MAGADRPVVGVDPGGRECGIIVRIRSGPVFVAVISRPAADRDPVPGAGYLNDVIDTLAQAVAVAETHADPREGPWVGCEEVKPPGGYARGGQRRRPIDPAALIGMSMVYGAVLAVFPRVIVVPVGGNGSLPLRAYPRELVGGPPNERCPPAEPKGTGLLRHARSAWDVAGAVPVLAARLARSA